MVQRMMACAQQARRASRRNRCFARYGYRSLVHEIAGSRPNRRGPPPRPVVHLRRGCFMKTLFAIAAACALACAGPALAADTKAADTTKAAAADTAKTPNSQQEKMKACNEQATDKKGDER